MWWCNHSVQWFDHIVSDVATFFASCFPLNAISGMSYVSQEFQLKLASIASPRIVCIHSAGQLLKISSDIDSVKVIINKVLIVLNTFLHNND